MIAIINSPTRYEDRIDSGFSFQVADDTRQSSPIPRTVCDAGESEIGSPLREESEKARKEFDAFSRFSIPSDWKIARKSKVG